MKKFQVFRYIKNLRYLIVAITLIGCIGIYMYTEQYQKYTSEVVIQYTNATAKEGTAPDGSKIDPKDIYSASVITDVKKDLGLSENIDQIRSACSVEEVISEDEEKRKNALLDDGEEYNEVCTVFRVKFQADSKSSKEYVRNVLDSIINNYYVFYSQKYIDTAVIPNNSLNISVEKYDYINCIEILEDSIDEINDYLASKANLYPTFRSARTGYTFADLQNKYDYIKENNISEYYAVVLGEKLTRNKEELVRTYQNRYDQDVINITNLTGHIEKERSVIDQYGDKVTKSDTSVAGAIGDNTDAIIEDVEEYYRDYLDVDTTYDKLIEYYVDLKSEKNVTEIDRDYCTEILKVFNSASVTNSVNTESTKALVEDMDVTIAELNDLYAIVEETSNELNEYSAANNIKSLSGIYAQEDINVKLYLIMALVLFFVIGCLGAVVVGRAVDFWQYLIYVDKKTGIANRVKCDMIIDEYDKKLLPENFVCISFKLNNLSSLSAEGGRNAGDSLLKQFGGFLSVNSQDYGFVGYNGGNMFIALFEDCSYERAENFVETLYNKTETQEEGLFDLSCGIAESSTDNIYEIRPLLKAAIGRTFEKKSDKSDESVDSENSENSQPNDGSNNSDGSDK